MVAEDERRLAVVVREQKDLIVERWVRAAAESLRGRITAAELDREFRELYTALLPLVGDNGRDIAGERYVEIRSVLAEMSRNRARSGYTPSETASSIFALKRVVFELTENDEDPALFRQLMDFSSLLDALGLITFETFSRAREEIITEQSAQLLELTTPVVKLWEGVLAVPLVGTLDSARTQVVMEKLLEALVETGAEHAIIDITGVLAVDTQVAQHLLKTAFAARLMGAECTISGIRPQIAQTIVALGIEFGDITTKASLADALRHALRREGVEIVTGGER
ncbi:STAS domain-containing protein [Actinosynnema sp. NPDC047251]|uniref:Anti-sigma-factor antagonist n=1 Tax=Saccharothrix espanaensis (strain ATCC 51144 / DSM 44229 / JCM 9112 / NBRC 15066 / NRRL 15764) TaxID=1179773 RepID=K0K3Z0_SACES|nr:STAS domain-containing protein [Saccharothrix espanaensis]CCH33026.1 Anti-sigma-factor antagonist [Saccharothrix espanaensis DSM 44229]